MGLNPVAGIPFKIGRFIFKKLKKVLYKNEETNAPKERGLFLSKYVDYDVSSNLSALNLQIRQPCEKKFMKVGKDSVIAASVVFENQNGFVSIGDRCFIGNSSFICVDAIEIGNDVMVSWGSTFVDNNSHSINSADRANDVIDWKRGVDENKLGQYKNWDIVKKGKIIIRDKAWIGFNCIIAKGVTIGEGAVLGAGSVVRKDVAPYTVVIGNPAIEVGKTV